jgi:hypothetical protein
MCSPGQRPVTSSDLFLSLFLRRVDPFQLQLLLLCKCTNTTKCTTSFSQTFFKELTTQLATPLDPSNNAKLDHSSLPLLIVWPSIINLIINFSTHLWPVKWNALGYTFALRIPLDLLQCRCNTCTNMINNDMIHSISSRDHIGSLIFDFTCSSPLLWSIGTNHHSTCLHTCNGSVERSLVLIFSTLITWLHVMSHMQWAPSSHVWALQHIQAISPPWHRLLTHDVLVD